MERAGARGVATGEMSETYDTLSPRRRSKFRARPTPRETPQPNVHEFRILAPTPERARELASVLIAAYDAKAEHGRPRIQSAMEKTDKKLSGLRKELAAAQKEFDPIDARTKKLEPYYQPKDMETRKWWLRVEIAGVKAKADSAARFLAKGELSPSAKAKVEEIKVENDIELVGLMMQLKELDRFKQMVEERNALWARHQTAERRLKKARDSTGAAERELKNLRTSLDELVPFRLVGPVEIRPIEWVKISPQETRIRLAPRRSRPRAAEESEMMRRGMEEQMRAEEEMKARTRPTGDRGMERR